MRISPLPKIKKWKWRGGEMARLPKIRIWIANEEQLETPELFHRIIKKMQEEFVPAKDQKLFLTAWMNAEPGEFAELYREWVIITVRAGKGDEKAEE